MSLLTARDAIPNISYGILVIALLIARDAKTNISYGVLVMAY